MNASLEEKLRKRFPGFYTKLSHFDIGDGWFDIVEKMSVDLEPIVNNLPQEEKEDFYAQQIKEKFGSLRVYFSFENDEISNIINNAEKSSARICETCGNPGKLNKASWVKTLCEAHEAMRQAGV